MRKKGRKMDDYNYDYIESAKKFFLENKDISEIYVKRNGKDFYFHLYYSYRDGNLCCYPCIIPKDGIPCYPPEHMCKLLEKETND